MPKFRFSEIAFNSTAKKKPTEEDKYTYIGLEHLDSGNLTVSRWGSDVAPVGEKLLMKKGDVLFGKRRAYQKKVAIAPFDGIFSAHGMVLRPNEEIVTKEYFPLFISSDYFLDEAIRISVGSLSPTVNWKDLKDIEFDLPTIEEQKRLTPIIWAAIETKNAYKKQLDCIDDLVKSQFIEMFGSRKEPKCEYIPLKILTDVCSGGTPDRKKEEFWLNGTIPSIKTTELQNNEILTTEEHITEKGLSDSSAKLVPPETILIAMYGQGKTRGMTAFLGIAASTNQACACILPTNKVRMKFLWTYFICQYDDLRNLAKGSNQANLNVGMIKNYPVPVPTLEKQICFEQLLGQSEKSKFATQPCTLQHLMDAVIGQEA